MSTDSVKTRVLRVDRPYDLFKTLRLHRMGLKDPTMVLDTDHLWRSARMPSGAATLRVHRVGTEDYEAQVWGPGGAELLEAAPSLLGLHDEPHAFVPPSEGPLRKLYAASPGMRIPIMPDPLRTLVQVILQQRVHWKDAASSFRQLVLRYGERAPGPMADLWLVPSAKQLVQLPSHAYITLGVERKRARVISTVARSRRSIHELLELSFEAAEARLLAFLGIGPWTAHMVLGLALGHSDAVPIGDFDLPHLVSWAFTGRPRGDDDQMREILEPYRHQRWRVIRWLMESGLKRPKTAPPRRRGPHPASWRSARY